MQPEMPKIDTMTQESVKSLHSKNNWDLLIWNLVKISKGMTLIDICRNLGATENEEDTLAVKRNVNDLIDLGLVVQKGIKYHAYNDRSIRA